MVNVTTPFKTDRGKVIKHGTIRIPVISGKTRSCRAMASLCYFVTERKQYGEINGEWCGEKYVAICVNLKMDGYGDSPEHAVSEMKNFVRDYLTLLLKHFKGSLRALEKHLKPDNTNQRSILLWDTYKKAEGREFTQYIKETSNAMLKYKLDCINNYGKRFTSAKIVNHIIKKEPKYNECYGVAK